MKQIILQNPAEILDMPDQDLEQLYWQTIQEEENAGAQKEAIKQEFKERVKKANRDGMMVNETSITLYPKYYTSKVTLETARNLGATKTEEKVDSTKITTMAKAGAKIEGVELREEIRITQKKKQEEAA